MSSPLFRHPFFLLPRFRELERASMARLSLQFRGRCRGISISWVAAIRSVPWALMLDMVLNGCILRASDLQAHVVFCRSGSTPFECASKSEILRLEQGREPVQTMLYPEPRFVTSAANPFERNQKEKVDCELLGSRAYHYYGIFAMLWSKVDLTVP